MKLLKSLYFWIILAFFAGCGLGILHPKFAVLLEPLGSSFIKLIKMVVCPIIFLTVATGIAQTGSLKKLGKIGLKAFIYFEIVSSIALLIGWAAASIIKPGSLIRADVSMLDAHSVQKYIDNADKLSMLEFLQNIIPTSLIEPFVKSNMLQILFIGILFGISLLAIGDNRSKPLVDIMQRLTESLFQIVRFIMYVAPLAIFGAMAYATSKFGGYFLVPLLGLIGTFYVTALIFIFVILGAIAKYSGFSIIRFLKYMAPELVLILGTTSSESALPQLLKKLENLGCKKETTGVVVPLGYSFNLDGTNIYITLCALFIAQALGVELTIPQQFAIFITAMFSSKGAAGVAGAGFIALAATLTVVPAVPAIGIVLILGIDRLMDEARTLVNYIGNGVGALVISKWENELVADVNLAMDEGRRIEKEFAEAQA